MKRIHFDVEEDGFYGAYWTCRDTHTAAGTDSIEIVPAFQYCIVYRTSVYSHSIVKNYLQFVPVCRSLLQFVLFTPSLKKCRESMGSNLGHGFSGHLNHFLGSHGVMKIPIY